MNTRQFEISIYVSVPDDNNPALFLEMPVTFILDVQPEYDGIGAYEFWGARGRQEERACWSVVEWDFIIPAGASEKTLNFIEEWAASNIDALNDAVNKMNDAPNVGYDI